ncbi:hypothetical protein FB567DRAFT_546641 [Paraphoma chrysanthemicola]|uniref:Uncharacterized protein n=1 Tax=Paraphoma chrysanthemicola TaxID=798071 RepID=A0A8K0RDP8_9PLEO|nr:hypothetical protein FB567DRAFT_546641 [Paraphoma chrysanthemicola]
MFFSKKRAAESNTSSAPLPSESVIDKLTHEVATLRIQREEFQVLYESNRQTLEHLNEDLDVKNQEYNQLRNCNHTLNSELQKAEAIAKKTVSDLQSSIRALEVNLEQAETERDNASAKLDQLRTTAWYQLHVNDETVGERNDLIKALKADRYKSQQQQRDRAVTELEALKDEYKKASDLHVQLNGLREDCDFTTERNPQITELQTTINNKQTQALIHDAETSDLHARLDVLQAAHDQHFHDKVTLETQLTALHRENENLATKIANADAVAVKTNNMANAILQQLRVLLIATAEKNAQRQAQFDGMYTQQIDAAQRFSAQLRAKTSAIRDLEVKLKQSELDSLNRVSSCEDQIAGLKNQIHCLVLDRDGEVAKADAWQELVNMQKIEADGRVAALEAQIVQLKACE